MRIALTGVSGFIGSAIARRAHAQGHEVTGLVRETSRRDHIEGVVDRFVVGDQSDRDAWDRLLDGADAVIHNSVDWGPIRAADFAAHLQANLVSSLELLRASAARPFVFISTIAVHHDMRPRWHGEIDEDHPLRPNMDYGAYKAAVEAHLWVDHFRDGRHTCAIRPCGVYGVDPDLERSHGYTLVEKLRRGEPITKSGGGKFVHVDDVAWAAVAALSAPSASGRAINLVDCYARWSDWAHLAQELMGTSCAVDDSSPASPANRFLKDAAMGLFGGSPPAGFLSRGTAGVRAHLESLIHAMAEGAGR
ncbi:MAG: NAD(P)-dependent oxidoreductase [Phycisphaeraceae bacterium]|nr:NAD(P)-dependent oxidoreductase [Phycisphaerales bacterium]MCB9843864.1 NAD(P)-dependent oxidoreductase [Phycisphaeraceae bacterium]